MKTFTRLFFLSLLIISLLEGAEKIPYRNIMYYGDWSIYSGQNNFYPSKIDAKLITHLIFAFLDMDSNGDLVLNDEYAAFHIVNLPELEGINLAEPYAGIIGAMSILKVQNSHLKLGISVGGPSRSGNFSEISRDKLKRQNFANNLAKFVDYVGFDFVDINLGTTDENGDEIVEEYPRNKQDSDNFVLLLQDIRKELNAIEKDGRRYELSATMSSLPERLAKIKYDKVLNYVNFTNLMTYDLNGAWNSYTAHQSPLYINKAYDDIKVDTQLSVDTCLQYLEDTYGNTIDMTKIVIGVAPYTRAWRGVEDDGLDKNNPGLYATALPNSVRSADGTKAGIYGFHELPSLIKQFGLVEYYDKTAEAAYYYSPTTGYFFTCDNEESIAHKGKYVKDKGLGGLFMWMASYDAENVISKAMFNSLYEKGYTFPEQELRYNLISISSGIKATETGYNITIQNNAAYEETNQALSDAEKLRKSILNMVVYIVTKSGTVFTPATKNGLIITTNKNGEIIVDPSSDPDSRILSPDYRRYTFSVKISGTPDVDDIKQVYVGQRILPSLKEFKKRIVYNK